MKLLKRLLFQLGMFLFAAAFGAATFTAAHLVLELLK